MAEIKTWNGRPAIFINGEPYPPMMATIRTINDSEIVFDEAYFRSLGESGIRIFFLICDTIWLKPNALELFDQEARALLSQVPDAYIIVRMGMNPPNDWIREHPEEVFVYNDGSKPGWHLFTESYETDIPHYYLLCSQKWREDAGHALEETWKLMMELPYADRIVGCFLGGGQSMEWYYPLPVCDWEKGRCFGESPAFRREFSKYLREVYGTEENLRKHWKNPDVTLDNPPVPPLERHYYAERVDKEAAIAPMRMYTNCPVPPPPGNGTNKGSFLDLDQSMDTFDFYRAWHLGTADSVLHFAKIVKEMTPDRLVGAFYGTQFTSQSQGKQGGVLRLLDSGYVDFMASPGEYENRMPGGCEGQRLIQDSFAIRGKIFIVEQDTRTLAENRYFMDKYGIYDMKDSINVMKREFGRVLCEDVQGWWFDQLLGGRRYKYPEIYELIKEQQQIAKEAYTLDRRKNSEIAFIYDEESPQAMSVQTNRDLIQLVRNYEMAKIGAPVDQYYHNDLSNPDMPSYKLYVFFNTCMLSEEEREAIRSKLKKDGAVAVWMYAAGIIDPMAEQKISIEHMEALTGMKMGLVNEQFDSVFRFDETEHPISKEIDKRKVFGKMETRRSLALPNSPASHWPPYLYPLVYVNDPQAQVIAHFLTSGYPAMSVKECDGFTSVHYGGKFIQRDVLRSLARFAGCHIYCESGDVLYANQNYLTFHASSSGKKKLYFRQATSPFEVYEKEYYGKRVTELEFDAYLGETKMFRVTEVGIEYISEV